MFSEKIIFKNLLDSIPLPSPLERLWISVDNDLQAFEKNQEISITNFNNAKEFY